MGKAAPKRCPNCGSTNIHNQELEPDHDYEELYDVYCRDCGWSGYISPDLQFGSKQEQYSSIEQHVSPEEMKELKALKREALSSDGVSLEEVLKKHGAKKRVKTLDELKVQLTQLKPILQEKFGVETLGIFGSLPRRTD